MVLILEVTNFFNYIYVHDLVLKLFIFIQTQYG